MRQVFATLSKSTAMYEADRPSWSHEHDMMRSGMAGIRQETLSLEEPSMPPVRMLIIDDEPSFVSALARLLSHDGATVDTAANGSLALTQLHTHCYDVVLCDLRMPTLDGPAFYATLLHQHAYLRHCVIFLTGDTLGTASAAFLEQCGRPWLHKPCTAAEVRHAIQQMLDTEEVSV